MTMPNRIFENREKAMEADYFRQRDATLIQKLREEAKFDEIAMAIRDKLQVDNPELLQRVRELGITPETAAAFLMAPLVQVAWGGNSVIPEERQAVLREARERGVDDGSPAQAHLLEWLTVRPSDEFFETAIEVIKYSLAVLPRYEQEDRIKRLVAACHGVAKASGSKISWVLGLFDGINSSEASVLDTITRALRRPDAPKSA
jgi:hypothetical protein